MSAAVPTKRHPIRGFFGGLLMGLGLAFLLISFSVIALGTLTPIVIVVVFLVLGVVVGAAAPARTKGAASGPVPGPTTA